MSKPWDQKWVVDGDGDVRRLNAKGEPSSLVFLHAASGTLEDRVLASAAPDMARALLNHVLIRGGPDDAHTHTRACWAERTGRDNQRLNGSCTYDCMTVRSALAKAGVPL